MSMRGIQGVVLGAAAVMTALAVSGQGGDERSAREGKAGCDNNTPVHEMPQSTRIVCRLRQPRRKVRRIRIRFRVRSSTWMPDAAGGLGTGPGFAA